MPTPVSEAARNVAEHASSVARLELELAALELKKKVVALGVGIALVLGAGVFALFAFGFALATVAAALATFLSTWLALLIVTAALAGLAGLLALVGIGRLRKGTPPVPEQAIREAKLTTAAIKS
jgi:Putative Actinobacterial Holin-X, holin superfamily III